MPLTRKLDIVNALIALALALFFMGLGAGIRGLLDGPVYCWAGTERLVSRPDEYPVYALECQGSVRVYTLD